MQSELDIAIVPAGPGDAADLAQVHVRSWRETYPGILPQAYLDRMSVPVHARRWRHRLMQLDEVTLVAEGPDGLVGFCSGDWARWNSLELREDARSTPSMCCAAPKGLGLGRRLLTSAVRALAARGATSLITVGVLRDNLLARGFYERHGRGVRGRARRNWSAAGAVPAVDYRWADIGRVTG